MNGFSVFVALAALGLEAGWEAGADGQLRYTIRLEQAMLEPLRQGQAVVVPVEAKDRRLVNFQIAFGKGATAAREVGRDETMVEHGWRPGENGGIDYLLQVNPERLETMAKGVPVFGQVAPEVTDIRRIYVFAGVGGLPRQGVSQAPAVPEPPAFLRDSGVAADAAALPPAQGAAPPLGDGQRRYEWPEQNRAADIRREQDSQRSYPNRDVDWRHSEGGAAENWAREQPLRQDASNGRYGDLEPYRASDRSPINRNQTAAGPPQDPNGQFYRTSSTRDAASYGSPLPAEQQPPLTAQSPSAAWPPQMAPQQQGAPQQQISTQQQVFAGQPSAGWSANQAASPPATVAAAALTAEDDEVRPWTPLILTTLALFASLGANAYLGWLAWSFFWRYRDAANDIARARHAAATRQAA